MLFTQLFLTLLMNALQQSLCFLEVTLLLGRHPQNPFIKWVSTTWARTTHKKPKSSNLFYKQSNYLILSFSPFLNVCVLLLLQSFNKGFDHLDGFWELVLLTPRQAMQILASVRNFSDLTSRVQLSTTLIKSSLATVFCMIVKAPLVKSKGNTFQEYLLKVLLKVMSFGTFIYIYTHMFDLSWI